MNYREKVKARRSLFDKIVHYLDWVERFTERGSVVHQKTVDSALKSYIESFKV